MQNKDKDDKWLNFKKWVYRNHKLVGIICLVILIVIYFVKEKDSKIMIGGAMSKLTSSSVSGMSTSLGMGQKFTALSGAAAGYGMERARQGASIIWDFLYQVAFVIIVIIIIFPSIGLLIIGMVCYTLLKSKMGNLKKL